MILNRLIYLVTQMVTDDDKLVYGNITHDNLTYSDLVTHDMVTHVKVIWLCNANA
jgi:hypothetical protein